MQTRFEDVAGPIALPGTFPIEQSDLRSRVLLWTAPVITLLAEIVYTRFDPLIGIGLYTLAILALLIQLGLTLYPSQAHGNASMTLMAFAVIRITTLTLQHLQIRREYQLGLIALGALVTVAITTRNTHFDPQPGALTSLTASALLQVTAVLAGVALGTVFYALTDAHLVPKLVVLPITVDITALGIGILAVTLFGFIEEISFPAFAATHHLDGFWHQRRADHRGAAGRADGGLSLARSGPVRAAHFHALQPALTRLRHGAGRGAGPFVCQSRRLCARPAVWLGTPTPSRGGLFRPRAVAQRGGHGIRRPRALYLRGGPALSAIITPTFWSSSNYDFSTLAIPAVALLLVMLVARTMMNYAGGVRAERIRQASTASLFPLAIIFVAAVSVRVLAVVQTK